MKKTEEPKKLGPKTIYLVQLPSYLSAIKAFIKLGDSMIH